MANYGFDPRTPNIFSDPPIDLIPQQNNEWVLQSILHVLNLIVDQLKISEAKKKYDDDQLSIPK